MKYNYQTMKNLFLRQSYMDSWEEYMRSLRKKSYVVWDYVVLTASNEEQAEGYRRQIEYRLERKLLPEHTKYMVLPDPDGKRVGSGGATFHVLRKIAELEASECPFRNKRILVIHSGGDSKRVPQYSACGKLFAPVLRELPNGQASTLFDEFIIGMSGVPGRIPEGLLVLSGDVLLLFNPLQLDFQIQGAAAISMKENVETGKDHGVFLSDEEGFVKLFLHKQSEERLQELGAVNDQGNVDLDTGAILIDRQMLEALYSLISTNGKPDEQKYKLFVNENARISFYGDFLYPLAKDATLEAYYQEAAEGSLCSDLIFCRKKLWEVLRGFSLKLLRLSPAEFIHFGTTKELSALMTEGIDNYVFLDWNRYVMTNLRGNGGNAVHTSFIATDAIIGTESYIENSIIEQGVNIGSNCVLSNVDLKDVSIPGGVVMHGLQMKDGRYTVRIYGIGDNPKETWGQNVSLLNVDMKLFLQACQLEITDLWPLSTNTEKSLWTARLYPVCKSMNDAVKAALCLYKLLKNASILQKRDQDLSEEMQILLERWKTAERTSLYESFNAADICAITKRKQQLEDRILSARFLAAVCERKTVTNALQIFGEEIDEAKYAMIMQEAMDSDFSDKIRIYYFLSRYMKSRKTQYQKQGYDVLEAKCFQEMRRVIFENMIQHIPDNKDHCMVRDGVSVRLPVRVNWGGGWTDTPPYCIEEGGAVLNAAIKLNGRSPVLVEAKRIKELIIRFESADIGVSGQAQTIEEIQNCNNPYDAFALHKASLIACGLIPINETGDLQKLLKGYGGGISLSTQVEGVPKGSGLGTSSILSAACVKALFKLFGQPLNDNMLSDIVLAMEQLMSTGGGWQDQVGGFVSGIKMITTKPGLDQKLQIQKVDIPKPAMEELQQRFVLIYTGQRRLARNLLRDVVGGYLSGRPETVGALRKMKQTAVLMKYELEQGNIDEFAALLNCHWELSKQLDSGSTNTCIDQIFLSCEDLLEAKFIAGAGGGGFLQGILKKGISREQLSQRLREVFGDSGVDVWDCRFV